jgi:hypothetical protein
MDRRGGGVGERESGPEMVLRDEAGGRREEEKEEAEEEEQSRRGVSV